MEMVATRSHGERKHLIEMLGKSTEWKLIAKTESEESNYYLFAHKTQKGHTIGVNDGVSDFYEDVIVVY